MNPILQMLMSRLQTKNPQNYKAISEAMRNNGNPTAMLQQLMKNATPQQRENLFKQCKQYNVPENILSQLQNMK